MVCKFSILLLFALVSFVIIGCEKKNEKSIDREFPQSIVDEKENVPTVNQWKKVNSIVIWEKTISVGMLSDDLFTATTLGKERLNDEEHIGKDVLKDPANPKSLLVTHHYEIENKMIDLVLARVGDPGPYRIKEILVKEINMSKNPEKQKSQSVKKVSVAGFLLKVGQDAYIPQGRFESYFVKTDCDLLSTHDSYYLIEGKTIIITYGPGPDGPYIVTGIKLVEGK